MHIHGFALPTRRTGDCVRPYPPQPQGLISGWPNLAVSERNDKGAHSSPIAQPAASAISIQRNDRLAQARMRSGLGPNKIAAEHLGDEGLVAILDYRLRPRRPFSDPSGPERRTLFVGLPLLDRLRSIPISSSAYGIQRIGPIQPDQCNVHRRSQQVIVL